MMPDAATRATRRAAAGGGGGRTPQDSQAARRLARCRCAYLSISIPGSGTHWYDTPFGNASASSLAQAARGLALRRHGGVVARACRDGAFTNAGFFLVGARAGARALLLHLLFVALRKGCRRRGEGMERGAEGSRQCGRAEAPLVLAHCDGSERGLRDGRGRERAFDVLDEQNSAPF